MPSINQLESGTMYSHTAVSTSRSPTVPLSPHAEPSPTLKDLFRGQPTETLAAGTALFWEGDKAGQVFDVLEGVMRILPDYVRRPASHHGFHSSRRCSGGFLPGPLPLHGLGRDAGQSPPFCSRPLLHHDQ
jgi:hypothetical protein